ncbi:MAG: hypothetical protein M1830_004230 [Pleopsidium flavum]|nr:MAG: hypothetical protein M1830_004230 [Pleopsidium flavum]
MENPEVALQQQLPSTLRNLQPAALQALHHPQAHHALPTLASQIGPDLGGFDPADANALSQNFQTELGEPSNAHNLQSTNAFEQNHHPRHHSAHANSRQQTPQHRQSHTFQQHHGGQFGILTPQSPLPTQLHQRHSSIGRLQQEHELFQSPEQGGDKSDGHFGELKIVPHPPNLEEWRERLFHVNEMITLTEDEFQTYFPHVDNIYSHRSTQKYKRKPFVSHYWDCRLKGRPPGTPKSDDPNKKKRKRTARQRDLCDVKIKITEYFPGAVMAQDFGVPGGQRPMDVNNGSNFFAPGQPGGPPLQAQQSQPFGMLAPSAGLPLGHPGAEGQRYYTVQRVNGNGGNGKGDGVAGPHKHTLEESDRVKRNSVERYLVKKEKEKKKTQVSEVENELLEAEGKVASEMVNQRRFLCLPLRHRLSLRD